MSCTAAINTELVNVGPLRLLWSTCVHTHPLRRSPSSILRTTYPDGLVLLYIIKQKVRFRSGKWLSRDCPPPQTPELRIQLGQLAPEPQLLALCCTAPYCPHPLVTSAWELNQESLVSLWSPSAGEVRVTRFQFFSTLCMPRVTMKAPHYSSGGYKWILACRRIHTYGIHKRGSAVLPNWSQQRIKGITDQDQMWFAPEMQGWFNVRKPM